MTVKRIGHIAVVLMATGSLMLGVHPALADGGAPFTATYSGSAVMTGQATVSVNGSGTATRMGRITNAGGIVLTGPAASCPGGIANVNTETLADPTGDTLMIVSRAVACPIGPGRFHGTGQWTVSGGTGRFAGATGQGSVDGDADFTIGTFTMSLTGTLGLPHE